MAESVIGAKTEDIVAQVRRPEGSLTVLHNTRDIVANTVGHVFAVPLTHTFFWTWDSAFRNPTRELAQQLFDRYKDVPWKGDVLVRVGQTDIFGDLKRIFARNEDIRGRPWMLTDPIGRGLEYVGRSGYALLYVLGAIKNKIFRSDNYNVFSNTATVYHPKLAVGMHELGHAEYFNQMDRRKRAAYLTALTNNILYLPFFRSGIEWRASEIALKRFKTDAERRKGLKLLEAAWGTYIVKDALATLAILAPALAYPLIAPIAWKVVTPAVVIGPKYYAYAFGVPLYPYAASLAGHFMNRLYPRRRERFGYVFGNTDSRIPRRVPVPDMSPRQVLVARAEPRRITGNSPRLIY